MGRKSIEYIFKTLLLEDTIKNGYKLKEMPHKYLVQKR